MVTVMGTPVTLPGHSAQLANLLAASDRQVAVVQDSPGFVAQRVLACIVNIACCRKQ